jgi:hypothetical protein
MMADGNTRNLPFENTATKLTAGPWQWKTGDHEWRWYPDNQNLNLGRVDADDNCTPVMYVPTLEDAAYFAEGFAAGLRAARLMIK